MNKPNTVHEEKLVVTRQVYEGILPPPEMLRAYEKIHEGAAKELFELAQKQQAHRIWMDQKGVRESFLELVFRFTLGVLGQIGIVVVTFGGYYMAYLFVKAGEPRLGYALSAMSATISGYLVWQRVRPIKQNK